MGHGRCSWMLYLLYVVVVLSLWIYIFFSVFIQSIIDRNIIYNISLSIFQYLSLSLIYIDATLAEQLDARQNEPIALPDDRFKAGIHINLLYQLNTYP